MARDQIEVDLLLNAKKAEATIKQMNRELGKMGKTMGQAFSGTGGGASNNVRALGTGLSKATVRADEFSKSLEASNARVIAFGASAGLIMNVDRALRSMVKTTIQVEKAMADVNVVMNISSKQLDQFGKGMFKIAKETAQGFSAVAEASTELARQGLGMEKTLARTKDALILTRLTGMNAADSVKSLTAAVNSFNKEGTTSSQVINRMAKVDAAFAVSSEDLAKAISRVGSSAVDAGVSLNQLMAITTSVQQKTARGGAVIGNAFKTIFTRIQRSDVRKTLSDIGVATTDMSGKMLDGVTVLENLSKSFGRLTKVQQASVAESVAGVFQVNILRAAMSDLSTKNSEYAKALRVANSATNEAYKRNEQLNQTLDALANKTMVNLTQAGAALGGDLFGPAIKKVLGNVNATLESFGKGGAMEGIGQTIGKGLVTGIGNFIGGPGLIIATAVFAKLALNLGKFAATAFKDIMGINTAVKQRAALEEIVVNTLASEPALLQKVKMGTLSVLDVEKQILATIKQQQVERAALKGYGGALAGSLYQRGTRVGSSGRAFNTGMGKMGKASGFVPNFANANSERAAAKAGGYTAGAIKTMSQPGAGTMMYNSAETVKQFPGMSQKAIMPPSSSSAGAGYRSTFGAAHGFNPYAAGGFVPNFASRPGLRNIGYATQPAMYTQKNKPLTEKQRKGALERGGNLTVPNGNIAMLVPQGQRTGMMTGRGEGKYSNFTAQFPTLSYSEGFLEKKYPREPARVEDLMKGAAADVTRTFAESIKPPARMPGKREVARALENTAGAKGALNAAAGAAFEVGMDLALDKKAAAQGSRYGDFDIRPPYAKKARGIFGGNFSIGDFKISSGDSSRKSMAGKIAKELLTNGPGRRFIMHGGKKEKALGYVPNFSPLSSSISRERQAGIPASKIRVGSSPALRSSGNPSGLGVYNTKDEPRGLNQGISRSRSMGINPKSHGAAGGFVPNFISRAGIMSTDFAGFAAKDQKKAAETQQKAAKDNAKASGKIAAGADRMMMAGMMINMALSGAGSAMGVSQKTQGGINAISNIGGMAMMGAGFGPAGIAAAAGLGALTSIGDIGTMLGFKDAEIAAEKMKAVAAELKQSFGKLKDSFGTLRNFDTKSPLERITALTKIVETVGEIEQGESNNKVVKSIRKNLRSDLNIDTILGEGNISSLPPGKLDQMEEKLVAAQMQILSATQGGDMSAALKGISGRFKGASSSSKLVMSSMAGGTGEVVGKMSQDYLRGIFSPEVQSKLVGVPENNLFAGGRNYGESGIDSLKDIGTRSQKIQALIAAASHKDSKEGVGFAPDEVDAINKDAMSTAESLSDLLGRAKLHVLRSDISTNIKDIKGENDPEQKRMRTFALSNLIASLSKDPSLQAFINPEAMGAAVQTGDGGEQGGGMSQAGFNSKRREGRIRRAGRAAGKRAGITARIGNIRRDKASRDVLRVNRGRMAGITMAGDSLIDEQGSIATKAAEDKAKTARTEIVVNQQGKLEQKNLKALDSMIDAVAQTAGNLETKNELIKKFNNEYKNLSEEDAKAKIKAIEESAKGEKPTSKAQDAELKFLEQRLIDLKENHAEQKGLLNEADKAREEEIKNIDAGTEARKKERKAMLEFQTDVRIQGIMDKATKTKNEAAGLRVLRDKGLGITGKEIAATDRAARRAAIRAGDSSGDPMAAFKESFAYGPTDAILEFEDGVVNVANTMKSSFADAFRAIASGSATAGEAIGAMAQSILDSISQVSTNMFANIMMSKMAGYSQGGYVQGYNSGGLITGGSGHKDDVPIRATGGEFVIKKSAVNKIGLPTLNSINGMANGGMSMGKMALIAGGASAASGIIGAAMQPGAPAIPRSQNYGMGKSKYGYLGGADPDARGSDMISGGGGRAGVSLNKAYTYYRRDPQTGQLISERARPTEGRFEVSDNLSLLGRLGEDDPQTARMFQKEQTMSKYQGYLAQETSRRRAAVKAVERKKRGNLIQAYANAAMLIGGAHMMDKMSAAGGAPGNVGTGQSGKANGGMIATMGGEYVMSPEAVRTHGVNFMTELNRGNAPGYASGGLVGSAQAAGGGGMVGGSTTNNVSINVNIDKNGKANADSSATSEQGGPSERDQQEEIENNKEFGGLLQGIVLQEIVKQQRPGGLLNRGTTGIPGGGY